MVRRLVMMACLVAFCFALGCEKSKGSGADKLEYNKNPPPKRNGVPAPKG